MMDVTGDGNRAYVPVVQGTPAHDLSQGGCRRVAVKMLTSLFGVGLLA